MDATLLFKLSIRHKNNENTSILKDYFYIYKKYGNLIKGGIPLTMSRLCQTNDN